MHRIERFGSCQTIKRYDVRHNQFVEKRLLTLWLSYICFKLSGWSKAEVTAPRAAIVRWVVGYILDNGGMARKYNDLLKHRWLKEWNNTEAILQERVALYTILFYANNSSIIMYYSTLRPLKTTNLLLEAFETASHVQNKASCLVSSFKERPKEALYLTIKRYSNRKAARVFETRCAKSPSTNHLSSVLS